MKSFTVHDLASAPVASQALLASTKQAWGFVPTLHGILAESPVALEAYDTLFALVSKTTLSPVEQQVVYLTTTTFNGCEYCTAGHTYLSRSVGMDEDVLQALRNFKPIADSRLQALRQFTESVLSTRAMVSDSAIEAFYAAGFTQANVLEIITVIATKTISSYTNHITKTPKESFMADPALGWTAPHNQLKVA